MATAYVSAARRPRGAPPEMVWYYIGRALPLCTALLLVAYLFGFCKSDFFLLREVAVVGENAGVVEEVAGGLKAPENANTLFFSTADLAEAAARFPRVLSAHAERDLPGRVVVRLEPRRPLFCLAGKDDYVMVDAEGVLLFFTDRPGPDYPRVHGDGTTKLTLGGSLNPECLATVLRCMEGARLAGMDMDFDLDLSSRYDYTLFTPDGTPVRLGAGDNMVRKVAIAARTEKKLSLKGLRAEYIDARVATKVKCANLHSLYAPTVPAPEKTGEAASDDASQ